MKTNNTFASALVSSVCVPTDRKLSAFDGVLHQQIRISFFSIAIIAAIIQLSGCKEDAAISNQDEVKAKLTAAATWKMQTVLVDGTDKSTVYKDLNIKFTDTGFTSTNGGVVWPATGTWSFTDADATAITRNDGLTVSLQEVTGTSLKLALSWSKTTFAPGRSGSVSGQHVFSFGN